MDKAQGALLTMLSSQEIKTVQKTFGGTDMPPELAIRSLFDSLFELDPSLRFMFPEDLSDLVRRFSFMLGFLVHRLDDWDSIVPRLTNLGIRHHSYGVRIKHYETMGRALMNTLEKCMGIAQDSTEMSAWQALYKEVSNVMISASGGAVVQATESERGLQIGKPK